MCVHHLIFFILLDDFFLYNFRVIFLNKFFYLKFFSFQVRGGKAGAAQDRQAYGEVRGAYPGAGQQAGPAPRPGARQPREGAGGEGPREECGMDHQVVLRRDGGGARGGQYMCQQKIRKKVDTPSFISKSSYV